MTPIDQLRELYDPVYLVTAQFVTMALQNCGSGATASYFTVKAALFFDNILVENSHLHGVI